MSPLFLSARFARIAVDGHEPVILILTLKNTSSRPVQLNMLKYPPANYHLELENTQRVAVQPIVASMVGPRVRAGSTSLVQIDPLCEVRAVVDLAETFGEMKPGKILCQGHSDH